MKNNNTNEQHWKILVLFLQEVAKDKFGEGYQTRLSEKSGMAKHHISRLFSLKYCPKLDTYLKMIQALNINIFFKDRENKTELNILFEKAMDELGRRIKTEPKDLN